MSDAPAEPPIFTKTFDFMLWLLPQTKRFPKLFRTTYTQRLLDATLDFHEAIIEANAMRGQDRLLQLRRADGYLNKVRSYLRLAHRLEWLSLGQYEHASRMVAEIGRLLGGWMRVSGKYT